MQANMNVRPRKKQRLFDENDKQTQAVDVSMLREKQISRASKKEKKMIKRKGKKRTRREGKLKERNRYLLNGVE